MSHRAAHRILAEELREARIDMGLPADVSQRECKPLVWFTCPTCDGVFRQPWQRRLHAYLGCWNQESA